MTTQTWYWRSLNWKTLGNVEGGRVLIADDQDAKLIRVRYPNSLGFGDLLRMTAEKGWVLELNTLAEVKLYCGPFDGEMLASFTYPTSPPGQP